MKPGIFAALLLLGSVAFAEPVDSLKRAKELCAQQPSKHVLVYYKNNSN